MYNQKTIDHFSNPRNMGELKDFDVKAEGGNPACGDVVKLWIKLSKDKKKIADIKFKAFGCGACIASTSALTELVKGKKIIDIKKITNKDIADYLGGLPPQKNICSNFSTDVLKKALTKI
jgi:nitrogen fixation NifU-like protein